VTQAKRRILAVDFGERRTGLAATDSTGTIVVPLAAIHHHGLEECVKGVAAVARERNSETVVVGLPLDSEGGTGQRAVRTLEFVTALRSAIGAQGGCEVVTCDESFTTDLAHERLRSAGIKAAARKKIADSVAALVLLERYRGQQDPTA